MSKPRELGNVCAIRRKSDGYWWECSAEHGAGWSDKRIRQSWTLREAREQVMAMFQRGVDVAGIEIVELVPAWNRDDARTASMATDDDMREIEAALTVYDAVGEKATNQSARKRFLALIRSKLPILSPDPRRPPCPLADGRHRQGGWLCLPDDGQGREDDAVVPERAVDMREIQMAVMNYGSHRFHDGRSGAGREHVQRTDAALDKAMNLIRQKLPPSDAEHERAVEAWRQTIIKEIESLTTFANKPDSAPQFFGVLFGSLHFAITEGVRLMRARPAGNDKEQRT